MPTKPRRPAPLRWLRAALTMLLLASPAGRAGALDPAIWTAPPASARPVARWWWPGGAVDADGIASELRRIRAAGFGAVELQPLLLGLSEADLAADPRVRTVADETFVGHVARAAREAAALGLAFDLTAGSGWPGGLPGRRDAAERQLLVASRELEGGARFRGPLPTAAPPEYVADVQRFLDTMGPFDPETRTVAVLALEITDEGPPARFERVVDLTDRAASGSLDWEVPAGRWRLLAFYENRTGHSVLGGAYPGAAHAALTVDHLSERGAEALWSGFVQPLLDASPPGSVRGLFIDSFELIGELPWTAGFRDAFRERKGYDPTPHLPVLFRKGGESKYSEMVDLFGRNGGPLYLGPGADEARQRAREDYLEVREALFLERFLGAFRRLAREHGVELRLQAHGGFADYLDAYALADVPESEGLFAGGRTDFLRLASSAAHVAGRPVASSESFITMRFWGNQLDVSELDLLAGRAFAAGINQIVHHGVPYRYQRSDGEAWYPFSGGFGRILAGPLPMTTWLRGDLWEQLPAVNLKLARLSYAMRQGEHVADVAWLWPEREFPDAPSFEFGRVDPGEGESTGSLALRERGLVTDRVSRRQLRSARLEGGALRIGAARYRALILDPMEVAEPALVERALAVARAGIPVIVIGSLPTRAPGLADAAPRDAAVRRAVAALGAAADRVEDEEGLAAALTRAGLHGPLTAAEKAPLRFSIDHRIEQDGHVLLVFNESWSTVRQRLHLTVGSGPVVLWDPRTGTRTGLASGSDGPRSFDLELAPAACVVLTTGR